MRFILTIFLANVYRCKADTASAGCFQPRGSGVHRAKTCFL